MEYSVIKALHIIFMVSYFAGIFYLVRLFVYFEDSNSKNNIEKEILQKQYNYMIVRLWKIITVPAGILMLFFGVWMIILNPDLLSLGWFHAKLTFLVFLLIFHFWIRKKINDFSKYQNKDSSVKLRMMNEVATFILFAVVFIVVLKYNFIQNWKLLFLSFLMLVFLIMRIVKLVNKKGKK